MTAALIFFASVVASLATAWVVVKAVERRPDLLQRRSSRGVWILAGASGLLALTASGAPTGHHALDLAYRALFAAAVVWASARGRRWSWIVGAGITLVAVHGSTIGLPVGAALGLALASSTTRPPGRVFGALIGLAVGQGLLRIRWAHPVGASALLAAAVLAMLAVTHLQRLRRRRRRRAVLAAGGLLAAVLAAVALYGLSAWGVRHDARAGLDEAQAALAAVKAGKTSESRAHLAAAETALAAVSSRVTAAWDRPAEAVPAVAQNVEAVKVALARAQAIVGQASALVDSANLRDLQVRQGTVDLARVRALAPSITSSLSTIRDSQVALGRLRSPWLVGPLRDRLGQLRSKLGEAASAEQTLELASRTLPGILGGSGPRRWVLAILDNSELRGGGGLMGEIGEIRTDAGRISLPTLEHVTDLYPRLPAGGADITGPADYLARYGWLKPGSYPGDDFHSPDFPTDARVVEQLYRQAGGEGVRGVVAVDPFALGAFLRLTGPVQVAGWPVPVSAANAVPILLHDQYVQLSPSAHVAFVLALGKEVFRRLSTATLPGPGELASILGPAAAGHHIQLYSDDPAEEQLFEAIGASGRMAPVRGDYLEVATHNFSLDKGDWYLSRRVRYDVHYDPATGEETADLTVTFLNGAPRSGEPAYVLGGNPDPPGYNRQWVNVYTPFSVSGAEVDGRSVRMEPGREAGRRVYSTYVTVPPGGSSSLTVRFYGAVPDAPTWHLDVGYQPASHPDQLTVGLSAPSGWRADGPSSASISQDREWAITARFERK